MALVIADRVKETTITTGTGRITLSGATFGGFQTFSDAIGNGNTTYYCIQNDRRFEIGVGAYRSSDNTLSRDTVLQSSNSDNLISLEGVSTVFCVLPAEKLVFKDTDSHVNIDTPLALKRSTDGDYLQAYSTDFMNRVVSLFVEEGSDPTWTIGLKTSSSDLLKPSYAFVEANDGLVTLYANANAEISIGDQDSEGLQVDHQLQNIVDLRKNGGEISVQNLDFTSTQTTTAQNSSIGYTVFAVEASIGHTADLQTWGVGTTEKASINADGDFETVSDIIASSGRFSAIRFSDATIQTTAALPFSSGSLIDQNTADIATVSGLLYDDAAISGYFESRVDQADTDIATVSGLLYDDAAISGYFESRVDQADSDITTVSGLLYDDSAVSGYFESRVDQADSDIATVSGLLYNDAALSGYFESRTDLVDSNIDTVSGLLTPSGESFDFAGNVLTYNNSDGGSFTADLSSLSTFDTSGVSLSYSAGILTYTNNAAGSFDVDLSSISGDVYALIVGSAPETLNTLEEIASALNDDENIATTLTNLISTTSGNLQSQITSNDSDISQLNSDIETVSGLLYDDSAVSGYFESRLDQADADILTVSGLLYDDAAISGYFESRVDQTDTDIATVSGLLYDDAAISGYFESRVDQADSDITTVSGLLYDDSAISGYFESRVDQAGADILTVSGLLYDDAAISGYFESRVDQADSDITTVSGLLYDDSAISGYFESRVDQADTDIATVSGLLYDDAAISGYFESRVDQADADILTVSGLLDTAGGSSTGIPSGVGFFDDTGSISGNNTLIYDGQDLRASGRMFASGQQVITSDEIFHIKQLTQAEYNVITPESATFYIISDASTSVVQSYREVSSDTTILTSDYTINATASLVLTLPTAVDNEGLIYNIKNTSTGNVIVSGVSSQTIDNEPSFEISTQFQSIKLQSTNSNWIIL